MARLKEFRFLWTDAWHQIDDGYDSILEMDASGRISIHMLVNLKPFVIDLTGREDSFIADLEDVGVADWNLKEFLDPFICDGDIWMFCLTYDSRRIIAKGMNGYPPTFPQFLRLLHDQYGLPKANIENCGRKNRHWILQRIKDTEIKKITRTDFATYQF